MDTFSRSCMLATAVIAAFAASMRLLPQVTPAGEMLAHFYDSLDVENYGSPARMYLGEAAIPTAPLKAFLANTRTAALLSRSRPRSWRLYPPSAGAWTSAARQCRQCTE